LKTLRTRITAVSSAAIRRIVFSVGSHPPASRKATMMLFESTGRRVISISGRDRGLPRSLENKCPSARIRGDLRKPHQLWVLGLRSLLNRNLGCRVIEGV